VISCVTANADEGIVIAASDGRRLRLAPKDFPVPTYPHDRVDVQRQIQAQIDALFPDAFIRLWIFCLDPLQMTLVSFAEEPPPYWWMRR